MPAPENGSQEPKIDLTVDPTSDLQNDELVMGEMPEPEIDGDIPVELADMFQEYHESNEGNYNVHIKKFDSSIGFKDTDAQTCGTFKNQCPSVDYIGIKYGPGQFMALLTYRYSTGERSADGKLKYKPGVKRQRFSISDEYENAHEEWLTERQLITLKKQQKLKRKIERFKEQNGMLNDKASSNNNINVDDAVKNKINETLAMAQTLGIAKSPNNSGGVLGFLQNMSGADMIAAAGLVIKWLDSRAAREREDKREMMNLIVSMNKPQPQGDDYMKQVLNKIMDTKDFMAALTPEKQTAVDKVIGLVESVLPHFAQLALQPRQKVQADPMVAMVQGSEEMKMFENDPNAFKVMVQNFDKQYGVKSADEVLTVMQKSNAAWAVRPDELKTDEYFATLPEDCRPQQTQEAQHDVYKQKVAQEAAQNMDTDEQDDFPAD